MAQIPFLPWVFQVIPEGIALATLTMALGTGQLPWKKNVLIGFIFAIFVYIVRIMPFTPGVHVIVLAAVLGVLCIYLGGLEMRRSLSFSAMAMACLVLLEFAFVSFYLKSGLFSFDELMGNPLNRIITGSAHTIMLFLLAYIVKKKQINLNFLFRPKEWM
ncbi:MAG: hypothetical protein QHH10_11310 [Peptococcaceae bacterium]|nr:hypothetical protein [Peptococcaceae bacterium]MDH7525888.1 hypothetical protein [Peptococcaceae bacterium]